MSMATTSTGNAEFVVSCAIRIGIPGKLESSAGDTLRQLVQDYVDRVLAALRLPMTAQVLVADESGDATPPDPGFELSIDGRAARVPPLLDDDDLRGLGPLALAVCRSIYENRELLVTPAVSRVVRAILVEDGDADVARMSDDEFRPVLQQLVRRGYSACRCERFIGTTDARGKRSALQYVDAVTGAVDCPQAIVRVSSDYYETVCTGDSGQQTMDDMLEMMQDGLFYELGIVFPRPRLERDDALNDNTIQVQVNDLLCPPLPGLAADEALVNQPPFRLEEIGVTGRPMSNPANDAPCSIVGQPDVERCERAGFTIWSPGGYLVLYLSSELRRHAGSYLTRGMVTNSLDTLEAGFPSLVGAARRRIDEARLTTVLRQLLDEEISIRDMRTIMDCLLLPEGTVQADFSANIVLYADGSYLVPATGGELAELEPAALADYVRAAAFRRYLTHKYTRGSNTLTVYLVDPDTEARLRDPAELDVDERAALVSALADELRELLPASPQPVLLTTQEVRRRLRAEIDVELPSLAVVSYQELMPDINIQPLARVSLERDADQREAVHSVTDAG